MGLFGKKKKKEDTESLFSRHFVVGEESNTHQMFKSFEIVPDVFAEEPANCGGMKVEYGGKGFEAGGELTPAASSAAPTVSWGGDDDKLYTLVFTDPDAPARDNPLFREFIHWVVTDIPGDDISKGTTVVDYLGPAPPCNSGLHRYLFLVFEQPKAGVVDVKEAAATFEGRGGKTTTEFIAKYGLGSPVAASLFQAQWGLECDAFHTAMGWLPPAAYQSESQKKAAASDEEAKENSYEPRTVADAWKNHFDAFGGQDLDKILLDYDEKSVVTVWDTRSDSKAEFKGVDGAKTLFTDLFAKLSDLSTLKAPLVQVEEDIGNGSGQVFLVWECPGCGYDKVTDTFVFRPDFKVGRQNIVVF